MNKEPTAHELVNILINKEQDSVDTVIELLEVASLSLWAVGSAFAILEQTLDMTEDYYQKQISPKLKNDFLLGHKKEMAKK